MDDKDIVRIGEQLWMSHNLYLLADPENGIYEDNGESLFTWEAAVKAAESVGDGWRLPTLEDWKKLKSLGIDITEEKKWVATLYVIEGDDRREILSFVHGHWH